MSPHTASSPQPQESLDWRAILSLHPAADEYPLLRDSDPAAFQALVDDILAHGLRTPIVAWSPNWSGAGLAIDAPAVIDGRNRLDGLAQLGLLYETDDHHVGLKTWNGTKWAKLSGDRIDSKFQHFYGGDPYALALSLNVHRRHLNAEQKRELIAKLLKRQPEASSNSIAKQAKADNKTVDSVRAKLEANSEIPNKTTERIEASGRKARGRKAGQAATKSERVANSPGFAAACERAKRIGREVELLQSGLLQLSSPTGFAPVCYRSLKHLNERLEELESEAALETAEAKPPTEADDAAASAEERKARYAAADTPPTEAKSGEPVTASCEFDGHVLRLLQLTNKARPGRFALRTGVPAANLRQLAGFLMEVASERPSGE
jgi:hypothetical protein